MSTNNTRPSPSLVYRIYNGLDYRHGYPIILTKPIGFVLPVPKKLPWWKRILGPHE